VPPPPPPATIKNITGILPVLILLKGDIPVPTTALLLVIDKKFDDTSVVVFTADWQVNNIVFVALVNGKIGTEKLWLYVEISLSIRRLDIYPLN
jgi:hypothetical protein